VNLVTSLWHNQNADVAEEIRVVIANSTRAIRDMLLDAIRSEPNTVVVAEVSDDASIPMVCDLARADCVVVPLERDGAPQELCRLVLKKHPDIRIIALTAAADIAALCWWSGREVRCTYMSASRENIVKALACSIA